MKIKAILVMLMAVIVLAGCSKGNTDHVQIEIGSSVLYSDNEIEDAMKLVLQQFEKGFEGCYMTKLWYDEVESMTEGAAWAENYEAEEGIVLYSNFWVDTTGRNPSLNPGELYKNWSWILVRSGGRWELKDWGYG